MSNETTTVPEVRVEILELPYDVMWIVMRYVKRQEDRSRCEQVCKMWKEVVEDTTGEYVKRGEEDWGFKITKLRFLLRKGRNNRGDDAGDDDAWVRIWDSRWTRYRTYGLKRVGENEECWIYERETPVPPYRLKTLHWRVVMTTGDNEEGNCQDAEADLCYQMFRTGLKYRSKKGAITIGSTGNANWWCCCEIRLLPARDE